MALISHIRNIISHKIIQEVLPTILIATIQHVLLTKHIIISMILLPFQLFPLAFLQLLSLPLLIARFTLTVSLLLLRFFLFGAEIGEFLDSGFVESVYDGVLAGSDEDFSDEFGIVEGYLACCH